MTSRQTAAQLGTSAKTVENQRASLKRKLGALSITHAAIIFKTPPIRDSLRCFHSLVSHYKILILPSE